ncbi:MAG: TetR/AcrR family transcriptional regulator [Myxococcota bacterium]
MPLDETEFLRKKPKQSRSRSVVNAIIEAADQLLERTGDPQKVSLQGIAQRAGVGIGSLYDYFANREGLLGAFLARITEQNFLALEKEVNGTNELPFDKALPLIVDATLRVYLEKPERTRATISTIFRLGWIKPVVSERDRFAGVLTARLLKSYPKLDPQRVQLTTELLCDCVMGVVMAELWREATPERSERVRQELVEMVRQRIDTLLAEH